MRQGIDVLAELVGRTLGPERRTALVPVEGRGFAQEPDALRIAELFHAGDPRHEVGAASIRTLVREMRTTAGDGAATAAVLARAMVRSSADRLAEGCHPPALSRGVERALTVAAAEVGARSRPVMGREDIARVVAAVTRDRDIGSLVAAALDRVGMDGIIAVDEGQRTDVELEVVSGMRLERGYTSPDFVTDTDRMEAVLDEPFVLVADYPISAVQALLPVLERVVQQGRPLLVVAEDVVGEAHATLVVNSQRGTLPACAVAVRGAGDGRAVLGDVAVLTGGTVVSTDADLRRAPTRDGWLGRARRVTVTRDDTTIVHGGGQTKAIQDRIKAIEAQIRSTAADADRERLRGRAAGLARGIAVVRVGAPTQAARRERRELVERARLVAEATVAEGLVVGGGLVPLAARRRLLLESAAGDEMAGIRVVADALAEPVRQIARSRGLDGDTVVAAVEGRTDSVGLDASDGTYADLDQRGILDAARVVRLAIQKAGDVTRGFLSGA
jgi:chaperonin GroEL